MGRGRLWVVGGGLLLLATTVATAQTVTPLPFTRGEITFAMQATVVNDFVGRVPVSRAEFTGTDLSNVRGVVEVRVQDMRTGIDLRDRHLREVMRIDSLPIIRFELTGVEPGTASGDTLGVLFRGNLTIRGVTRPVRIPGSAVISAGGVYVTASTPIDMREYAITPPVRGFGLVKVRVSPVTQIVARLTFGDTR